ncbi:hypothetical protein [Gemmatimonas sp.]|uniref:hypothetical protein n=1 Tax=Gemmatimonas sp. TaxID=1962908 RepID=UPI00356909A5
MGVTLIARFFGAPRVARRALSLGALIVTAVALVACDDANNLLQAASSENTARNFSVYALSGTSSALPAAYQFTSERLARPQLLTNGGVNFDVAFDLTSDNKVTLLPVRTVVPLPPAGVSSVGLLKSTTSFSALERAPDRGYAIDSTLVIGIGETVVLQLPGSGCFSGEPYYAKLVVDSIIVAQRRIVVGSLVNRNCGFRALTVGIPKN